MLHSLVKLANHLDSRWEFAAANAVDNLLRVVAQDVEPPFSKEEAQIIADAIGVDFSKAKFNLEDFQHGLRVELEHGDRDPETDVVHHNYLSVGRIAWAHLKEDPRYYNKLAKVESED